MSSLKEQLSKHYPNASVSNDDRRASGDRRSNPHARNAAGRRWYEQTPEQLAELQQCSAAIQCVVEWETHKVFVVLSDTNFDFQNEVTLLRAIAWSLQEATGKTWYARLTNRSGQKGDLRFWVIYNQTDSMVLVDPLAVCRTSLFPFKHGKPLELHFMESNPEYFARKVKEDAQQPGKQKSTFTAQTPALVSTETQGQTEAVTVPALDVGGGQPEA